MVDEPEKKRKKKKTPGGKLGQNGGMLFQEQILHIGEGEGGSQKRKKKKRGPIDRDKADFEQAKVPIDLGQKSPKDRFQITSAIGIRGSS